MKEETPIHCCHKGTCYYSVLTNKCTLKVPGKLPAFSPPSTGPNGYLRWRRTPYLFIGLVAFPPFTLTKTLMESRR